MSSFVFVNTAKLGEIPQNFVQLGAKIVVLKHCMTSTTE